MNKKLTYLLIIHRHHVGVRLIPQGALVENPNVGHRYKRKSITNKYAKDTLLQPIYTLIS